MDAVRYNVVQSRSLWRWALLPRRFQAAGKPDSNGFASEVATFQAEQGDLKVDGKLGPKTWWRIHKVFAGVPAWVHTGTGTTAAASHPWTAARVAGAGFKGVVLTLNRIFDQTGGRLRRRWKRIARPAALANFAAACANIGMGVDVLVYPHPKDLAALEDGLAQQLAALAARDVRTRACVLDLEENWEGRRIDWQEAGHELVHAVRRAAGAADLELVVTGISHHSRTRLEPVIRYCDAVAPQGMSSNARGPKWASPAPGRGQELARDKWARYDKPIRMVLAAYGQGGIKGHTPASALETSYRAAVAAGSVEVSYWDLRAAETRRTELTRILGG